MHDDIWTRPFKDAVAKADNIRVLPGPGDPLYNTGAVLLHEVRLPAVQALVENTTFDAEKSGPHCMCPGNPWIEFYTGSIRILMLSFHHGESVRWNNGPWKGDAFFTEASSEFYLKWLEERGVTGPRQAILENRLRVEKSDTNWQKWLLAMPPAIRSFVGADYSGNELIENQLAEQIHSRMDFRVEDKNCYIVGLFKWYGSGEGTLLSCPSYEILAELLLLKYSSAELLSAIQDQPLEAPLVNGVLRLFGSREYQKTRKGDLKLFPPELKRTLLEHSFKSRDGEQKRRAQRTFGV